MGRNGFVYFDSFGFDWGCFGLCYAKNKSNKG